METQIFNESGGNIDHNVMTTVGNIDQNDMEINSQPPKTATKTPTLKWKKRILSGKLKRERLKRTRQKYANLQNINENKLVKNLTKRTSNALLSHIFFLNDCWTKHICVGFESNTFQPVAIIRSHRKQIQLNAIDWYGFFLHVKEGWNHNFAINKHFKIHRKETSVTIHYLKENITLKNEEFEFLIKLSDYIHNIFTYNYNNKLLVKQYFDFYVSKCSEKLVRFLKTEDFFTPDFIPPNAINYSRLFYEIPNFCKNQLDAENFLVSLLGL